MGKYPYVHYQRLSKAITTYCGRPNATIWTQGLTKNGWCINPSKSHPHSFPLNTHRQITPYYTNFSASVSFFWMVKSPWNHSFLKYPGNWLIVTIAWMFSKCFWVLTAWRRCTCHPTEGMDQIWPTNENNVPKRMKFTVNSRPDMEIMSAIQRKTLISSGIWFWQPKIEFFFNGRGWTLETSTHQGPRYPRCACNSQKAAESMAKGTIGALNHNLPGEICLPVLGQPKSRENMGKLQNNLLENRGFGGLRHAS